MQLRDYQAKALDSIIKAFEIVDTNGRIKLPSPKRILLSMATGAGKTVVFSRLSDFWTKHVNNTGQVLIVCPTEETREQSIKSLLRDTGHCAAIIKNGKNTNYNAPFCVTTYQTLARQFGKNEAEAGKREAELFLFGINLIIIDEAHRTCADSFLQILNQLKGIPVLGVTATPERLDGMNLMLPTEYQFKTSEQLSLFSNDKKLGDRQLLAKCYMVDVPTATGIYSQHIHGKDLNATTGVLIEKGYLSHFDYYVAVLPYIEKKIEEAKQIKKITNQLRLDKFLSKYWLNPDTLQKAVDEWVLKTEWDSEKPFEGISTVVFSSSVEHGKKLVSIFKAKGVPAEFVDAQTKKKERNILLEKYRNKEILVLINYSVFVEGMDAPNTKCIYFLRKTMSKVIWLQAIGRGLRVNKEQKLLILDAGHHVKNSENSSWKIDARNPKWKIHGAVTSKFVIATCPHCAKIQKIKKHDYVTLNNIENLSDEEDIIFENAPLKHQVLRKEVKHHLNSNISCKSEYYYIDDEIYIYEVIVDCNFCQKEYKILFDFLQVTPTGKKGGKNYSIDEDNGVYNQDGKKIEIIKGYSSTWEQELNQDFKKVVDNLCDWIKTNNIPMFNLLTHITETRWWAKEYLIDKDGLGNANLHYLAVILNNPPLWSVELAKSNTIPQISKYPDVKTFDDWLNKRTQKFIYQGIDFWAGYDVI